MLRSPRFIAFSWLSLFMPFLEMAMKQEFGGQERGVKTVGVREEMTSRPKVVRIHSKGKGSGPKSPGLPKAEIC